LEPFLNRRKGQVHMHATGDRACRAALQALEGLPREEVRAETINNRRLLTVLTKLHLSKLAL